MRSLFVFLIILIACLGQNSVALGQNLEGLSKQKPFKISGGLSMFSDLYTVNGIAPRSTPFNWRLTGSPTVSIYGINLPFFFNVGSQNSSFTQPFNHLGVSPTYKWVTAHIGWRNLSYSQFTLAGLVFMGGGIEVRPGKFRLAAMYGRFNRAVREDTAQQFIRPLPTYQRTGFSGKIGFGDAENFIDLVIFKAKDDSSTYLDAPERLKPAENAIFGINNRLTLFKHIRFTFDGAVSAFTRDTRLAETDDPDMKRLSPVIFTNASTQLLTALNSSIGYVSKHFNLRFQYRRVDQDYKSMGAYLFQTDVEEITLAPSLNFKKGKIRLNGSIGRQRDNLLNTKMITTQRLIGSAGLSINTGKKYGIDIQYGNYGIAQRAGVVPLNDTIRLAIANQNFNVVNRLSFINKRRAMTWVLLTTYQEMMNLNPLSPAFLQSQVIIANLNMNYTFLSTGLNLNGGFNYSRSAFSVGELIMLGPLFGVGKAMLKNRLNTSVSAGVMTNSYNSVATGLTVNGNVNLNYKVNKTHSFLLNARVIQNSSNSPAAVPFTEVFLTAGYQLNFY